MGALTDALLDTLGYIGSSLDKPGRAVRGLLAGKPEEALAAIPFSDAAGITDESNAVSGRGLLEHYGLLQPKQADEGFGLGDMAGMGAELALDPTNWFGAGAVKKLIGLRGAAGEANALRAKDIIVNKNIEQFLAKGAMPEEIARTTRAVDETGRPIATYHGTPHAFEQYDLSKMDRDALYGPGVYTTADPAVASNYAHKGSLEPEWRIRSDVKDADMLRALASGEYYNEVPNLRNMRSSTISPEDDRLLFDILSRNGMLEETPGSPINVRKQFLDIRRPFDIDERRSLDEATELFNRIAGPHPEHGQRLLDLQGVSPENITGHNVYNNIVASQAAPWGSQWVIKPKASANELLKQAGYDAIQHMGGGRIGGGDVMHQVYIALNPSQVYQPMVAPALRQIPELARKPSMSPLIAALAGENALSRAY